jgi:hypothetical protein
MLRNICFGGEVERRGARYEAGFVSKLNKADYRFRTEWLNRVDDGRIKGWVDE